VPARRSLVFLANIFVLLGFTQWQMQSVGRADPNQSPALALDQATPRTLATGGSARARERPGGMITRAGSNEHVSHSRPDNSHYEATICRNDISGTLIAASMAKRHSGKELTPTGTPFRTVVYRRNAGDGEWAAVLEPSATPAGDPTCALTRNGRFYYAYIGGEDRSVCIHRSDDDGRHWHGPWCHPYVDRPHLAVLPQPPGEKDETVVYAGQRALARTARGIPSKSKIVVYISRDGGQTIREFAEWSPADGHGPIAVGPLALTTDGRLLVPIGVIEDDRLPSLNVGTSYEKPIGSFRVLQVAGRQQARQRNPGVQTTKVADWFRGREANMPALAVDRSNSVFHGRIYAVWNDVRFGRPAVLLSRSVDDGDTWSVPAVVDADLSAAENRRKPASLNPSVAVDRAGVVAVSWIDRRKSVDGFGSMLRMAMSFDGADSFTSSLEVSEVANTFDQGEHWSTVVSASSAGRSGDPHRVDVRVNPWTISGGHHLGMTAAGQARFYPIWVDNRTGIPQLWTAPMEYEGAMVAHGSTELSSYRDVTSDVKLQFGDPRLELASGSVSLAIRAVNSSSRPVRLPLVLRLTAISSLYGDLRPLNAENGHEGPGAWWRLTREDGELELLRGQFSSVKELKFNLTESVSIIDVMRDTLLHARGWGYLSSLDFRILEPPSGINEKE
jgi:hypothetical protein